MTALIFVACGIAYLLSFACITPAPGSKMDLVFMVLLMAIATLLLGIGLHRLGLR